MAATWNKRHRIGSYTLGKLLDGEHRADAGRCSVVEHRLGHVTGGVHRGFAMPPRGTHRARTP